MLIKLTSPHYKGTKALVEAALASAKALNHGVSVLDKGTGETLEIFPDDTLMTVYLCNGLKLPPED